jgi:23S rRNA (cytidine1920-2'-O)/16S rRNA (cytidine1409-2'-O)-methyltransferase
VHRDLAASRTEAQEAIRAGLVTIDGAPALKAATQVGAAQAIVVAAPARAYVSRGGEKLAHALDTFDLDPSGRRCLDAGVSTGGFTDCLLQRGADHVLAYDVGYGQVHERVRTDPRVTVRERTNVRDLTPELVPSPPPDLLVADLSFISLSTVLPVLLPLVAPGGDAVLLVKPQFEAQRHEVGKGGVVRDPEVWSRCLGQVVQAAAELGWRLRGATASSLLGPAGNVEFLVHLVDSPTRTGDEVRDEVREDDPSRPVDPTLPVDGSDGAERTTQRIAAAVAEGRERRAAGRAGGTS